jgi:hypothetical protein
MVVKDALSIDESDVVTITTWDHTIDVANAFAVECFRQGADAIIILWTDEYYYGLLRELSEASLGEHSKICEMSLRRRQPLSTCLARKTLRV